MTNAVLAKRSAEITHTLPESLEDLHIHQQRQAEQLAASSERRIQKLLADAWCAAFVQRKTDVTRSIAITHAVLENFGADDGSLNLAAAERLVTELTRQYRFFHWHVEFPHIFRVGNGARDFDPATGWSGGFSCVIGNPPWDQVQFDPRDFFASRNPTIANIANMAERENAIAKLEEDDFALYTEYKAEQRYNDGVKHFVHDSGKFPLTSYGRLNTHSLFTECVRSIIAPHGRLGVIVPTGIATDAMTASFFRDLVQQRRLDSLLDFVTNPDLWQEIGHGRMRFSLLTITGASEVVAQPEFATLTKHPRRLPPRGQRIHVSASDLLLVNPNTGTCPMFQTQRDAEITIGIYRRVPVLCREDPDENPWGLSFQLMFMMNTDSKLFRTREQLQLAGWILEGNTFVRNDDLMLPLYEAKLIHQFDHRLASYDKRPKDSQDTELPRLDLNEKNDPSRSPIPHYWVDKTEVDDRLSRRSWDRDWLLGWRDICRSSDERTVIATVIPRSAVGNKFPLLLTDQPASKVALLAASLSSFALDYCARQKMSGTTLNFYLAKQLPVLPPSTYEEWESWMCNRILELTYTSWDIRSFARDLGDDRPPFRWDEERRSVMRAELDAAFFHLYGIDRGDVEYIMETFPIVKRKDIQQYGTFRTKDLILQIYDAMAEAARTGASYQTRLNPPPGRGPRHSAC